MTTTAKIGAFFVVVLLRPGRPHPQDRGHPLREEGAHERPSDAHFKDVAGLDDKSAVRIAGVRVGKVDGISLRPDGTALAHLALDPIVELHQGAIAQVRSLGMLGDKYVELTAGDPAAPAPSERRPPRGSAGVGFDDITKLAADIGKDLKEVSGAMAGSLGGPQGEDKLNRIVDNLGRLAESLRELVDSNRGNVDVMLANLKALSEQMKLTVARVDRMLDENRTGVKDTIANMDEVTGKLKTTADNLNSITGKIDTGQGTLGKLLNDDETHKNINDALKSVKEGVESLSGTLGRLNRLQLDIGFRVEYATRPRDGKYYFTLDAIPKEGKFYRLEIGAIPHGKREDVLETSTVTFPDGSQQTISTTGSALRGPVRPLGAARVPVQEHDPPGRRHRGARRRRRSSRPSRRDTFRVAGEVWDFTRPDLSGHVKLYTRWNASPNLYVTGGVDDLLNPGLRSPFLGVGHPLEGRGPQGLVGSIPIPK